MKHPDGTVPLPGRAVESAAGLGRAGRHGEAIEVLEAALSDVPADRALLSALADAQIAAGRRNEAFATYNRLLAQGDVTPETWNAIGQALMQAREYAQAAGAFNQSLAISDSDETRHHLGQALFKLGDIDAAAVHLEIAARRSGHLGSWLALATIVPGAPSATQETILAIRRDFADHLAASPQAARPAARPKPMPHPAGKLRVGYLSSWFASSNYMKPVWALINNHDRERFEISLFSDNPERAALEGYQPCEADPFHATGELDNSALAELIARRQIDILIDLNGYSTPRRLGLFTTAPAPVTVAWFNMYATSGLPGYHYIIGDDQVVEPADDRHFSEKVLRLPMSYLTFTTPHRTPPVVDPPCMTTGRVTFGSLVAQYKMTPAVMDAWAVILRGAPGSRLFLANRAFDADENRRWVADRFRGHGIAEERLLFGGSAGHYDYLKNYDRIDLALDAFPYNGGTTTMEAIWQGVPVLTFDGGRWASRTSQTLLRRTHLGEFAYDSRDAMVASAIALANDPDTPAMLHGLRHQMHEELERAPVCDAKALADAMEALLESLVARS